MCSVVLAAYNKNIGLSNSLVPITLNNGAPVVYGEVIEYNGDGASNIGKTIYSYHYEDYESRNPRPGNIDTRFFNYYHSDGGNYIPELTAVATYKFNDGAYELVRRQDNYYTKYRQSEFNTGVNFGSTVEVGEENWGCDRDQAFMTYHQLYNYLNSLVYTDTKGYEEVSLLTSKIVKDYSNTSTLETTTNYTYDNNTTLLKSKITTNSKGEAIKNEYKYPTDFSATAPYSTMVTRNILSPTIEQSAYKNDDFLESSKTNYNFWNSGAWSVSPTNMIVPQTVDTKTLNQSSYETRIHYYAYDSKGNVLSVSKEDDALHSYIWNYNNTYPVAEAINAAQSDVAFSSFESDGKGNWSYIGTPTSASGGITGAKAYSLASGAISKTGLTSSKKYLVSYWLRSGSVTVGGGTQSNSLTGKTVNGWTYHEVVVTGAASISLSGSGVVDELRLYPSDAQMTTYTYEPLIGMTGQCDAKNNITYYEYDGFGRLQTISDEDKNILKGLCYNYAGQPDGCGGLFYNSQKSGNFTRNNCAAGGSGSAVTYTVAANTYSSTISQADADQKAQNAVNTNGQAYANQHGYCTWWNVQKSGAFTKNNCGSGSGSTVTYTVAAHAYSSTISQADADQKAQNDVNTNGQAYANQHGSCTWWNVQKSGTFTKNDCSSGYGATVTYTVAAHSYSSAISQGDADQKAQNDVTANGQAYANQNGVCMSEPVQVYARMEVAYSSSNNTVTPNQYGGMDYDYYQWVSIYMRFYSDPACTQPYTLTHSISFDIKYYEDEETETAITSSQGTTYQGTVNAGNSEFFFDDIIPFESFWASSDSNEDWIYYEKISDDYDIDIGGGMIVAPPIYPAHTPGYPP